MRSSLAPWSDLCLSAATCSLVASSLRAVGLLSLFALSGCAHHPLPNAAPATHARENLDTTNATVYAIDASQSEVAILVYRAGALARLGHNHVMTAKNLAGRAWIHPQFEKSGFDISLQVRDLIVDDADARRAAGSEFPPEIPQSDKDGTRANMLKADVLDAERFPEVRVQATHVHGDLRAPEITAGIAIKDVRREVTVPITLTSDGTRLVAQGEFDILQSEFGMKPFSVGLGTLQVQDRLHIRFRIVAVR
jgi:polyisoprenoid-binding protein YceI